MKWNIVILLLMMASGSSALKPVVAGKTGPVVTRETAPVAYYIDSRHGSDKYNGMDKKSPWKTIAPLQHISLHAGDSICFKRGSSFTGPLNITGSGAPGNYITLTDYGLKTDAAAAFTNPVFVKGNYGNGIRVSGSYIIVENLYFSRMAAYAPIEYNGEGWVEWEMGAIHIDKGAEHCIIRNNEIKDCVAGIRSNGEFTLIEHNYIHDCNRVLKEWNWGPLGIWLGADHQEVCYNRIINYSAVDPRIGWGPTAYGGGADGGALEIDDARYDKSDISIHHNYTRDNQGFLEVTWTDVKKNPGYRNFQIHHNVSDDYQQFIALWRGEGCRIEDNTIIRRKVNANEWGVFNITQNHSHNLVRNNTIVAGKGVVIFNTGKKGTAQPQTVISHNTYYADGDSLQMGKEGPGDSAVLTVGGFPLAENGKALANISLPRQASAARQFAASELSHYLSRMSGAVFAVRPAQSGSDIVMEVDNKMAVEDYTISVQDKNLLLAGGSDRAVLYAVYDLLHRLGCVWLAPAFDFYKGQAEYIPKSGVLEYDVSVRVREHPRLAYRKLDVEEGRSHTIENLQQLIDWMPKARLNVLMIPLNYQGAGRVQWDKWRTALSPELKKRGLLIEVGGHGYQNFINAKMEGGLLFQQHPEWFGKNKEGQPDDAENLVFNTSNPQAVNYFISKIQDYLRKHPEIDIFDCWPPDVAKWAECREMAALGAAVDRQALLMNQVDSAIKRVRPGLRLEIIAYGQVLQPPHGVVLHKDILVDVCPINQSFERPINDTASPVNTGYAKAIESWRQQFPGDLGLYSYYRKYAWQSIPTILAHYIQRDLQWYAGLPFQAVSTYAEPGDWYTYELNHYLLACLAWNPDLPVDRMVERYAELRYGPAGQIALAAYRDLEEVVRNYCSIPYTSVKAARQIDSAAAGLRSDRERVEAALGGGRTGAASGGMQAEPTSRGLQDTVVAANLQRLSLMLQYAIADLDITKMRASGLTGTVITDKVKELVDLLERHAGNGVFVVHDKNNFTTFLKHYNSIQCNNY